MKSHKADLHERRFNGGADVLRAPQRVALLDVPRVRALSLEGIGAGTLLDVGAGTGLFAEAFSSRAIRVTGIDPNPELLAQARLSVPAGDFREAIAEKLPFEDGTFDIVFLGLVLHETDDPLKALREARRAARKRVVILEWPYREDGHGPPLAHRIAPSRVMDLLAAAGYPSVERIELAHVDFYRLTPWKEAVQ